MHDKRRNNMISSEVLRRYSFFASMTEEILHDIATIGQEKTFPKDTILFQENTAAKNLMLLLEGAVELFYSRDGDVAAANFPVCSIVPGAIFGVSSLIAPFRYTASARATMPVRLVDIDGESLRRMSENNQALGRLLMNNVAAAVLARLH